MLRKISAVIAGVLVVGVVVWVLQFVGSHLHPLPEGLDPTDPASEEAFRAYLSTLPIASWILAFVSEILGATLGGLTAASIARDRKRWFASGIFALALLGSIMNWVSFSHPVWFIVGQLVGYPLALLMTFHVLEPSPSQSGADALDPPH